MKIKRQLIIALILIFAFVSLTANIGSVEAATSRVAIISKLEGTVDVQKSGGKKTLKGFKNMSLNEGDVVSTGSKSSVELKFSNGTSTDDTLVLESNTTVTFSKLSNRNGTVTKVKMKNGKAWVDVKSIQNSSDDFQLETPTAIMGVRGTNFFVGIDPSTGKSVLAMFAGVVKQLTDQDNYQRPTNVYPAQIFYTANDGELLGNMSNESIAQLLQNSTPAVLQSVIENLQKIKNENDELLEQFNSANPDSLDQDLQELLENDVLRTNIERIAAALLKEAANQNLISADEQEELMTALFGEDADNKEDELINDKKNNDYDFILNQKTKEMLDQLDKSNVLEEKKAQLIAEQERKRQQLEEERKKREQEALDRYLNTLPQNQRDEVLAARDRVDRGTNPMPTPPQAPSTTPSTPTQGWSSVTKPVNVIYGDASTSASLDYSLVNSQSRTLQLSAPIQVGVDSTVTFAPSSQALSIRSIAINGETLTAREDGSYVWNLPAESKDVVVVIGMRHTTYGTAQYTLQGQLQYSEALPPIIVTQPEDKYVTIGGSAQLSVVAQSADNGSLSYQWYVNTENSTANGTPVSGGTNASYYAPTDEVGTKYYYVVVTNTNNNVNGATTAQKVSSVAQVTVNPIVNALPPTIITQPSDTTVVQGGSILLNVVAVSPDNGSLTYQWYRNSVNSTIGGSALAGETGPAYMASAVAAGTSYYYVEITNTKSSVNGVPTAVTVSRAAEVTVEALIHAATPEIITEPEDHNVDLGDQVLLSVEADSPDGGDLSYQWYRSDSSSEAGEAIVGATTDEYTVPTETAGTSYYYVVVTNSNDEVNGIPIASVTSRYAEVIVNPIINAAEPVIQTQPQSRNVDVGDEVLLSVVAESPDGGGLTYQWYVNTENSTTDGTPVGGGPNASYYAPTDEVGTKYYYVIVTNTNNTVNGSTTAQKVSSVAQVTVNPIIDALQPAIITQPTGTTVVQSGNILLTVEAESPDNGDLTYQWYRNSVNSTDGASALTGETNPVYMAPAVAAGTFYYYVEITNTNLNVNGEQVAYKKSNVVQVIVEQLVNAADPFVLTEPQDSNVGEGAQLSLIVVAEVQDDGDLTYQWYRSDDANGEGEAIVGATATVFTVPTGEVGTSYYYVVITNTNSEVNGATTATTTSRYAKVVVNPIINAMEPIINVQPQNHNVDIGDEVTLSVVAESPDDGDLTYQWYVFHSGGNEGFVGNSINIQMSQPPQPNVAAPPIEGILIPDATGASYDVPTDEAGEYTYYVVVTNTKDGVYGVPTASVTSDYALVTINELVDAADPYILIEPENQNTVIGVPVTLGVDAWRNDAGELSYQWYSNTTPNASGGTEIEGETNDTFTFTSDVAGTYYFYVVVTNTNNDVNGVKVKEITSEVVEVVVNSELTAENPIITNDIESRNVQLNSDFTLYVEATIQSEGYLSYQWYVNSVDSYQGATEIDEALSPGYTVPTNELGEKYYFVEITNTVELGGYVANATTRSQIAQISVLEEVTDAETPFIQGEFYGNRLIKGEVFELSVYANVGDGGELSYQWYVTEDVRNEGTAIEGATSYALNISADQFGTKYYYVVVTNTNEAVNGVKTASARTDYEEITVIPGFHFVYESYGYDYYIDYYSTETEGVFTLAERIYKEEEAESSIKIIPGNENYTITKVEVLETAEEYEAIDEVVELDLESGYYSLRITLQDYRMDEEESYILEFEVAEPVTWEEYGLPFDVGIYNSAFEYYNELPLTRNENDYSPVYGARYPTLQGTGNFLQLSLTNDELEIFSVTINENEIEPEDGVYSWELNQTAEPVEVRIYVMHDYLGEMAFWINLYDSWEQYYYPIDLMVNYKNWEFPQYVAYSPTGSGNMFLETQELVFEEDMQISISSYSTDYDIYEVIHYDEQIEYNDGAYTITLTSDNVRKSPIYIEVNHYILGNYEFQLKLVMDTQPTEAPVKMMLSADGNESRVSLFGNYQATPEGFVELYASYRMTSGNNMIYFDVLNEDHEIVNLVEEYSGGSTSPPIESNYDTVTGPGQRVWILTVMDNTSMMNIQYRITVDFTFPL